MVMGDLNTFKAYCYCHALLLTNKSTRRGNFGKVWPNIEVKLRRKFYHSSQANLQYTAMSSGIVENTEIL